MSKTTETKHDWAVTSGGTIYTSQGSKQIATFDTAIEKLDKSEKFRYNIYIIYQNRE